MRPYPIMTIAEQVLMGVIGRAIGQKILRHGVSIQHRLKAEDLSGICIDFAFPEAKLAVEVDSVGFNSTSKQIERDMRRDGLLREAGWTVLRFTEKTVMRDPSAVCGTIMKAFPERHH